MEDELNEAYLALEEWRKKCGNLQKEKESLLKELTEATEKKDEEIDSLSTELSEYIQKITDLNEASLPN